MWWDYLFTFGVGESILTAFHLRGGILMTKRFFTGCFCLFIVFALPVFGQAVHHPKQASKSSSLSDSMELDPSKSVLAKSQKEVDKVSKSPVAVLLYKPNYILPFYYTGTPFQESGNIPAGQSVEHPEVKFQISFMVPVFRHLIRIHHHPISLNVAYTQLSYWQLYQKTAFFRETNYNPQMFLSGQVAPNWLLRFGVDHQSNGRGGMYERSWNRLFLTSNFSMGNWLLSIQPWVPIFKAESIDIYNPNITKYLGYERTVLGYKFNNGVELSVWLRNIEHGRYFAVQGEFHVPITHHMQFYVQVFHGYGQSLIEYNQKTTSGGVGISLNGWV